jgi:hypothetical protein
VRDAHLSIAVASLLDSTFRQVVCCAPPHMAKAIKEQFDTTEDFSSWSELCRILPAGRSLNQHRSCIGARNASLLLVVSEFLMLLILFSYELNTLAGLVSLPFRLASRVKWCITGSAAVRKSSLARSAASLWLQYPCLATTCCPGRCWRVLKPSYRTTPSSFFHTKFPWSRPSQSHAAFHTVLSQTRPSPSCVRPRVIQPPPWRRA